MEQIKEVLKESKVKNLIFVLGCILAGLIIFQAGMFVGFKKAGFSFRTGEEYFRQMNGRPNDQFMGINRGDFENSHGAMGKIISIKLPFIVVSEPQGSEKTIVISTSTDIKKFKGSIKSTDLKVNDFVVVIGSPTDNAEVEAKLIRIMPDPAGTPFGVQIGTSTQIKK